MPAKPVSVGLPCFYLDQSTVSDAIRASYLEEAGTDPDYTRLLPWIERIAREANLCIGWPHVYELAKWSPRDASTVAEWLDALPVVWLRQTKSVMDSELESAVRRSAGAAPSTVEPFAPSYLATYAGWNPEAFSQALGRTALPQIVADARSVGKVARWDAQTLDWAERLHRDRLQYGGNEAWARAILKQKAAVGLEQDVAAAHGRLLALDADYAKLGCGLDALVTGVAELHRTDLQQLRCYRVTHALHEAFAEQASKRQPGSRNFLALASSGLDIEHAGPAAAYCDVFTCDRLTSAWLGEQRLSFGFRKQLARGEFPSSKAFVDSLIATWP